jgi:NAD(P)H-quinone oxidoreductase subunit 5
MNPQELTLAADHDHAEGAHDDHEHHSESPHESPFTMTLPLVILAVPSILIGLVGTPFANYFEAFIHAPGEAVELAAEGGENLNEFLVMAGSSVGISLIGISLAILMYGRKKINPAAIAAKIPTFYQLSKNKWYFRRCLPQCLCLGQPSFSAASPGSRLQSGRWRCEFGRVRNAAYG